MDDFQNLGLILPTPNPNPNTYPDTFVVKFP